MAAAAAGHPGAIVPLSRALRTVDGAASFALLSEAAAAVGIAEVGKFERYLLQLRQLLDETYEAGVPLAECGEMFRVDGLVGLVVVGEADRDVARIALHHAAEHQAILAMGREEAADHNGF